MSGTTAEKRGGIQQSFVLASDSVAEWVQAPPSGARIPAGRRGYHSTSQREYGPRDRLDRRDRKGEILLCRDRVWVELRDLMVTLQQGEAGSQVHMAWVSLELAASGLSEIGQLVDPTTRRLSYESLADRLRQPVTDAFRSKELQSYSLACVQGQAAVEATLPTTLIMPEGFELKRCILRRVATAEQYQDEKRAEDKFAIDLLRLAHDAEIGMQAENARFAGDLRDIETDIIRGVLTSVEQRLSAIDRFQRYLEIFRPQALAPAEKRRPCPFPYCHEDLSVGQTFTCGRCKNEMHSWHRSPHDSRLCRECWDLRHRARIKAALILLIMIVAASAAAWAWAHRPALWIHYYAFGQREEADGTWSEFKVENGTEMYTGDQFRIHVVPSDDCYLYAMVFQADGSVSQLFPHPMIRQQNPVREGQECQIADRENWFTLEPPPGREEIFLVASREPISGLDEALERLGEEPRDQASRRKLQTVVRSLPAPSRNIGIAPNRRYTHATLGWTLAFMQQRKAGPESPGWISRHPCLC